MVQILGCSPWVTLKELKANLKKDLLLAQFGMDLDSVCDDLIDPLLAADNAKEFNRLLAALKNTVIPGYIDIVKRAPVDKLKQNNFKDWFEVRN